MSARRTRGLSTERLLRAEITMPRNHQVHQRLTHRYSDAWAYLDESRVIGAVKVLSRPARVFIPDDAIDVRPYVLTVVLPAGLNRRQRKRLAKAYAEQASGSACRHEFDCCGCISWSCRVRRRNGREVHLVRTGTRNY